MKTIPAKTILTRKKDSSWFGTDYNMNLYKGCCHGCIYCDSRSDCYQVEDFDTVRAKENALDILQKELKKKTKSGVIATGSMSDPYNPFEIKYQHTRQALKLVNTYHFGISIATKSNLITRDIDILKNIKEHSPVICKITVTAAEDFLCRKIEPDVCVTSKRLEAIKKLSDAGIFTGILMMPLLPFLTDSAENILAVIRLAHQNGAKFIYPFLGVSLRNGQREYLYQKLDELFPGRKLSDAYRKMYGDSYVCHSPKVNELWPLFTAECERLGLLYRMPEIIKAYKQGYDFQQLTLPL
jgi:DNA repair photolyase